MATVNADKLSRRTMALLYIYVITGLAGFVWIVLIAIFLCAAAFGVRPSFNLPIWPWFPANTLIMIFTKIGANLSSRHNLNIRNDG